MKLSNNKKRQVALAVEQALEALRSGRLDICEQWLRKIEAIHPDNPDAADLRGVLCAQAGQLAEAEQHFVNAINSAPKRATLHTHLGDLYLSQRLYSDALPRYRSAAKIDPHSLPAHLGLSKALLELGFAEKARQILEKMIKRHGRDPNVLMGLFSACYRLNLLDEGLIYLEKLLQLYPDYPEAHFELGKLKVQMGSIEAGESDIRTALKLQPNDARAHGALADIRKFEHEDADTASMIALHARSAPLSGDRMILSFALGKIMDDLQQHDRAFAYFKEANDIRSQHTAYNSDEELAHLQQIMEAYTPSVFERNSGLDDSTPIFIVGMPRCGSTLVEQILAAHPDVASRGECEFFEKAMAGFNDDQNPLTLDRTISFSPEEWRKVGETYLDFLKANVPSTPHITDKSLTNIRLIGAIHCAMPKARIIHVRRHPLDSCLSIYRQNLQGKLFDFGCNLGELGYYYKMYLRLMQHWREVLPADVMYEMDYEQLVGNQEAETRKLLDACDLDWNEQCLQFSKTKNVVRTASVTQVRRGIYSDSLAAWKRYEKHLDPLIRILGTEYGHPPVH